MWTALTFCCSLLSSSATDRSVLSFCAVCVALVGNKVELNAHAHCNQIIYLLIYSLGDENGI